MGSKAFHIAVVGSFVAALMTFACGDEGDGAGGGERGGDGINIGGSQVTGQALPILKI